MANNILKGKRGIIFGALDSKSIAWKVAEHAHAEGAKFVLTNAPIALRMGTINELSEKTGSKVIPADATSMEDLKALYEGAMEELGGKIDFVLHSIGMSVNVRKGRAYYEQNYDWTMKGYDVSALSFHKTMQAAWELDALNDWGSIVGLSYIAAQRVFHTYNDMAACASAQIGSVRALLPFPGTINAPIPLPFGVVTSSIWSAVTSAIRNP